MKRFLILFLFAVNLEANSFPFLSKSNTETSAVESKSSTLDREADFSSVAPLVASSPDVSNRLSEVALEQSKTIRIISTGNLVLAGGLIVILIILAL